MKAPKLVRRVNKGLKMHEAPKPNVKKEGVWVDERV